MIEGALRTRLREAFGTTLPRFDFMAQLARVPEGLTMGELSRRMMVSGGNASWRVRG
jgi:DNA-binding MarR family transcriptional regulator